MRDTRERCDHCGKWVQQGSLVIPNVEEHLQDGRYGICNKCSNRKKDREYWNNWIVEKKGEEI